MKEKLIISPKTKVLHLIESYPELEEVLISNVPAFKKLKNPVLRKTVASIATLQQAAAVGSIKVEDLINLLRKEIGQDLFEESIKSGISSDQPLWFSKNMIVKELDAKPMLAVGEHPVAQVMEDLKAMKKGEIYTLLAPFIPAPLIDKATSMQFEHWLVKQSENSFLVYFCKPE
ncbi:MAG: DUF1858 domain-containing protein [Bacteroidales bacterium]|nr:DUF1858 domain-containing protein [Bacteroidales bacterium]